MVEISKNLNEFESTHILTLESRAVGFSERIRLNIEGNSLYSSVFVKSTTGSPSLTINYFEITTGLQDDVVFSEKTTLENQHPVITAAATSADQKLISPFHNKLFCEIDVTGTGTIEFGIYVTVVSSFASLLDQALKNHLEAVDLINDQGMPLVLWDPDDSKWYLAKGDEGCITINGSITANAGQGNAYEDVQTTTTPGIEQTLFSTTVGVGLTKVLSNLIVTCRLPTTYKLESGGAIIASGRTGAGHPTEITPWNLVRGIAAGTLLELKLTAASGFPATDVEAYLHASDI